MTSTREEVIREVIKSVPGSIHVPGRYWDVDKRDRAVTIEDTVDDLGVTFVITFLRITGPEADDWEFTSDSLFATRDQVLELAKEWLR